MIERILYASLNAGKAREVQTILGASGLSVVSAVEIDGYPDVEETGSTFAANACLKAEAGFRHTQMPALAEDAGLAVLALDNEPGIYSSRYLGDIPQAEKNLDIIRRLDAIPGADRTARFHSACAFCYQTDDGLQTILTEGLCYGIIAGKPRGEHGFGYDPIFLVPEAGLTFAEMAAEQKNRISHRRNALNAFKERLTLLLEKN